MEYETNGKKKVNNNTDEWKLRIVVCETSATDCYGKSIIKLYV